MNDQKGMELLILAVVGILSTVGLMLLFHKAIVTGNVVNDSPRTNYGSGLGDPAQPQPIRYVADGASPSQPKAPQQLNPGVKQRKAQINYGGRVRK